jgi:hypothetical protein
VASGGPGLQEEFDAPIVEIRRRIADKELSTPGYTFEFDFPDFREPRQRVVSKNLEAWGNELLAQFRQHQAAYAPVEMDGDTEGIGLLTAPSRLKGSYHVVRNDDVVISVEYILDRYFTGAAHGGQSTRVQNFLLNPFRPITLADLLAEDSSLAALSAFIRERLLSTGKYDEEWVLRGTEPEQENFARFVLDNHGLRFIFEEYQIDCYAAGRQELWVGYGQASSIWNQPLFAKIKRDDF